MGGLINIQIRKLAAVTFVVLFIGTIRFQIQCVRALDLGDYDDVSLYPTFKMVIKGNYSLDESLALKKIAAGETPLAKICKGTSISYVFGFNVQLQPES